MDDLLQPPTRAEMVWTLVALGTAFALAQLVAPFL
jgi:hypothetical protein